MKVTFSSEKHKFLDGYIEGPFAHGPFTTDEMREMEYYMQWIHPLKLQRVSLRTPVGYRITYGYAEDVWNNDMGIKIEDDEDTSKDISITLKAYLKTRNWFKEMEKLTGYMREQGEGLLLLYFDEDLKLDAYDTPVDVNEEILGVEAFNKINYDIIEWDDNGEPVRYSLKFSRFGPNKGAAIPVHASRVLRLIDKNIESREKGYSLLSVVYDSIVILSNINKGAGEAAYRWGTGHPLILTKDLTTDEAVDKMKTLIGTPTRRSWHMLPSEYIESFTMIGQAGQMLNLKSLADMMIDQIVAATGIPRPILLGEVAGVVTGSEVNERSYFALLDKTHTDLEPFVRMYFERDINIRKLLNGFDIWEIDWGLREVLSKEDFEKLEQLKISNALALTTICTIDEVRQRMGLPPIGPEYGGDIILGLGNMYSIEGNAYEQMGGGTSNQQASTQTGQVQNTDSMDNFKDSIEAMRGTMSVDEICERLNISRSTFYRIEQSLI